MEGGEASGGSVATTGEGEASGDDVTSAVAAAKRRKSEGPEVARPGSFLWRTQRLGLGSELPPKSRRRGCESVSVYGVPV